MRLFEVGQPVVVMNKKLSCVIISFALHQAVWGGSLASSGKQNIRLSILRAHFLRPQGKFNLTFHQLVVKLRYIIVDRFDTFFGGFNRYCLCKRHANALSSDNAFFPSCWLTKLQQSNRQSRSFEVFIQSRPYCHNYLRWPAEVKFFSSKFDRTEFFLNS